METTTARGGKKFRFRRQNIHTITHISSESQWPICQLSCQHTLSPGTHILRNNFPHLHPPLRRTSTLPSPRCRGCRVVHLISYHLCSACDSEYLLLSLLLDFECVICRRAGKTNGSEQRYAGGCGAFVRHSNDDGWAQRQCSRRQYRRCQLE